MRNLRSGVAGRGRLEERVGLVLRGVTLGVLLDLVDGSLLSRGLRFSDELLSLESGNAAGACKRLLVYVTLDGDVVGS